MVIWLVTIGFFDNLFKNDIKEIVREVTHGVKNPDSSTAKVKLHLNCRN